MFLVKIYLSLVFITNVGAVVVQLSANEGHASYSFKYFSTNSSLTGFFWATFMHCSFKSKKECSKSKKCSTYHKYTLKDWADIAKYSKEYGGSFSPIIVALQIFP